MMGIYNKTMNQWLTAAKDLFTKLYPISKYMANMPSSIFTIQTQDTTAMLLQEC